MDPSLHDLLLRCDVKGSWEHPPDANWARSTAEIEQLRPALEASLGVSLKLDTSAQDASFFADLGLLAEQRDDDGVAYWYYDICLRFSWFSKLYTIHGNDWESYKTDEAMSLLRSAGFTYVPEEALAEPYDGVNTPYEPNLTWWVRYFDYL